MIVLTFERAANSELHSFAFLLALFMTTWYRFENARRDRVSNEVGRRELTPEQIRVEQDMADDAPFFRYIT